MFIGRKEELKELRRKFDSDHFEVILVSGKRRIGKSQLIVESLSGFEGNVISYECFKSTYHDNLENIEKEVKKRYNDYLHFASLYDLILFLHESASDTKTVLVIDEYPYMRDGDTTDSEIKNAIDRINESPRQNPLKIVLCGSAIDVMNILDNQDKPLYGRFTSKITLKELNYLESSAFYSSASNEDKIGYYSVLGGVPYYLKQIDEKRPFEENIIHLFFSSNPLLQTELESQINNEISKLDNAPFIMGIIKDKTLSYTDILQVFRASYPEKSIDYLLDKLMEIEAIEKCSIKQDNGKQKPYYRIRSASLRFYYSFLHRQFANRLLFGEEDYYDTFIKIDLLHSFIPHAFERIGMEFIALMNRKGLLPNRLLDLYPYVINDKASKHNYEFDIVGECAEGLINYECKYQDSPIDASKVYKEIRQAELSDEAFIKTVFISKSPVLDHGNKIETYTLSDLFSDTLR